MRYLIPMAGGDSLFPREEFHFPKPLIEIDGEPMIARVVNRLRAFDPGAEFIFVVQQQECAEFGLDLTLEMATDGHCKIVRLARPTAGAATSALMASEYFADDKPLIICNADQLIDRDHVAIVARFAAAERAAGVITFSSVHPRWSYVRTDAAGTVIEAAEKRVISKRAIAGFYYFASGADFVRAAQASIANHRDVKGLYYIAPTLNELILEGKLIGFEDIPSEDYHSFYSPQRLEYFERQLQSREILKSAAAPEPARPQVNVVIPMAGLGSRFSAAGYERPKPFIDVAGQTMIERVMENLQIPGAQYVLLARDEHLKAYGFVAQQLTNRGDVSFVEISKTTEGAACTLLFSRGVVDWESPLLIANCDQIVDFDCSTYIRDCLDRRLDGSILVFEDAERNPKWSFARLDDAGLVAEVKEKQPISSKATVGIYFFTRARDFIDGAVEMIINNDRVNNEFYVAPVYNYIIARGAKVGVYEIAPSAMHGIGTPPDLEAFVAKRYPR